MLYQFTIDNSDVIQINKTFVHLDYLSNLPGPWCVEQHVNILFKYQILYDYSSNSV